jgi:hypothetical protein
VEGGAAGGRIPEKARSTDVKEETMQLYAILRRNGWSSADELQEAAARSTRVGNEEMPDDVRWIRSYVLDEGAGSVGTICIYEGTSPDAIREHASRAGLPADEVIAVADTVVVRPDPTPATA